MLKVLIADDEPDICELINKLIDWKQQSLSNIGFAYNGNEALELILRQKPDIVITDIQMPGQTGLEIIEKTRGELPNISFVVVSGYQEFEYAQQALRFGVKEYLLKPVSKKELNLILERIVQEKGLLSQKQAEAASLRENLYRKNLILRKNELSQCVSDFERVPDEDVFDFQPGVFLSVCVHTSLKDKDSILQFQATEILENIGTRICDMFRENCFDIEYCVNDCNVYVLMNYSETDDCTYNDRLRMLQSYLQEMQVHYSNLFVSVGIGLPVSSEVDLRLLQTAEYANTMRLVCGVEKVIEYRQIAKEYGKENSCQFDTAAKQKLLRYMESNRREEAFHLVEDSYSAFKNSGSMLISRLFRESLSVIEYLRTNIVGLGLRDELDTSLMSEEEIHRRLANIDSIDELKQFVLAYIKQEMEACRAYQENKVSEPIRLAQEYVKNNIHRQISLEEAAEQAFVSATYFSTLFKKQTGKNFSDYLIETRIEEAKRLLKDPSLNISEISLRVGYADSRHFSKLFQKMVGLKPTAYRKIYI